MTLRSPLMIDIAPLLPLLDVARKARDELAESEARFQALSRDEQQRHVGGILDQDRPYELAYEDAVRDIMDSLLQMTATTLNK